jgi:putative SOS response-associated peptidase YedK
MPSKVPGKLGRPRSTNNARIEGIEKKATFKDAWLKGRRCLIPATWYQEPNWETGKNIWWQLKRADRQPWMLAGLWSEWTDPKTGEIVPNFTAITTNCDTHPLLNRLHKPDPSLPPDQQDKRSLAHIDPADWDRWFHGSLEDAKALVTPQPAEVFDLADAIRTDAALAAMRAA